MEAALGPNEDKPADFAPTFLASRSGCETAPLADSKDGDQTDDGGQTGALRIRPKPGCRQIRWCRAVAIRRAIRCSVIFSRRPGHEHRNTGTVLRLQAMALGARFDVPSIGAAQPGAIF
jgi:hypothetical protein